jgi:general secretion pathway protein B
MSYILEALKKSDRERRQGEIPGLQSDHGKRPDPGKKRHKQSVWAGIAAGVIVLAALVAFIFFWGTRKNDAALQEKITALEKSLGQLQEQPGQSASGDRQPATEAKTADRTAADETESHPRELPPPVTRQEPFDSAAETADGGEGDEGIEEWAIKNEQPAAMEKEAMLNPEDAASVMPQETVAAAKTAVPKTAGAQTDSLPLMQDLPANIRKRLPPLTLAGHVFSENAAKRMIIINNRICREGDMVEDGLFLDRIIWEGVVLRYQEIRFRMNLL